ncbi:head-tail connector protein [Rhodopseudomonas sp. RCAM05734]|uniref:head-tail connector protein n=1 Tax=Rhodopseudomonas sp. RCAM05734 TaxID=3457549 RepID=UPI004043D77B
MRLVPVTPPANEPLSAEDVRARLNIGTEISDDVLDAFVSSARQVLDGVDGYLGRALVTQTWKLLLPCFPHHWHCDGAVIMIPLPPLQDINSISYVDNTGASVIIDPADYRIVQGPRPYVVPVYGKSWPPARWQSDAVEIEFVAGYGDEGTDVPEPIRCAIALSVSQLRSLSTRDQNVMVDSVIGVGSKTYATGRDGGADALGPAAMMLVSTYRVLA